MEKCGVVILLVTFFVFTNCSHSDQNYYGATNTSISQPTFYEEKEEILKLKKNLKIVRDVLNNPNVKRISSYMDVNITTDGYKEIISDKFPRPYPTTEDTVYEYNVGFGPGFGVEMIVKAMDLAENDYVLIQPGGKNSTDRKLVFSWYLINERKYKLFHLDDMTIEFVILKNTENTHTGFQIYLKRLGVLTTTEIPSTTTEPPITVAPQRTIDIFMEGRTAATFVNISEDFRIELANIADLYCKKFNISISENISIYENVNYHTVRRCNYEWPNSVNCIMITFSIAVYDNNETGEYELTVEHLGDMWNLYKSKMNLTHFSLSEYYPPDDMWYVTVWVGISAGVLIGFIIIIFLIWKCGCFREYVGPLGFRESLLSQKNSIQTMYPTPHQSVPSFFGQDFYNPDDEEIWTRNNAELPPKYDSEQNAYDGQDNQAYVPDGEFLDMYIDDIMSLPDGKNQVQFRLKSGDKLDNDESCL